MKRIPAGALRAAAPTDRPRRPYFSFARTTMLRPSGVSSANEGKLGSFGQGLRIDLIDGDESTACAISERDCAGFVEQQHIHISCSFNRPARMAMTLRWIKRSIPAIPIAESKPPIVVGIRQTSNATRTVMVIGVPCPAASTLYSENGRSVMHTIKKMIVKAGQQDIQCDFIGCFLRFAPSTRSIMRSRKPSPGLAVT